MSYPATSSEQMMINRAEGVGYWPGPDGVNAPADGRTMKQLRSWAQWADSRNCHEEHCPICNPIPGGMAGVLP